MYHQQNAIPNACLRLAIAMLSQRDILDHSDLGPCPYDTLLFTIS